MNFTTSRTLQVILAIILVLLAAASAWVIQGGMYRVHLRFKAPVIISLVLTVAWILMGIWAGQWLIGVCSALSQLLAGLMAAYGGRRSELGRHDAGQILGLRSYLKKISKEDVQRIQKSDPDYFFNMAPFALALGIIHPFARNFGSRKLDQCPYLMPRVHGRRTADEWADMMAQTADLMDARQRRAEYEKWTQLPQNLISRPRRQPGAGDRRNKA